jgi:hypothetical protein
MSQISPTGLPRRLACTFLDHAQDTLSTGLRAKRGLEVLALATRSRMLVGTTRKSG